VLLGPDDHRLRSTGYVQKVLEQKIPAIPSGGMHFTDIRDVATALVRIAAIAAPRDIYHLPGCNCSLAEFIAMITEISGVPSTTLRLPAFAALGLAKIGARLPKLPHWLPDPVVLEMSTCYWGLTSLFAHELGYAPRSARQTLSDTIEWLRGRDAHSQLEPS
jgi:nucleoside-diphosphate-sugar epimerase